jgi:hypothetical protein
VAGRALLPYALAAALVGCGAEEPPPAPRLAAEVKQYRSDIAKRTVAVTVSNRSDRDVVVRSIDLQAAGFDADPAGDLTARVPAGSQVDVRVPYGELRCADDREGTADVALLDVQDADGTAHDLRLELAPGGVLDRLHVRECADQVLREVVDVRLSSQWSRDGRALTGALVLERRSGGPPVTVVEPGGNVLFTLRPALGGTPMGRLAADAPALEVPLRITATRCDVHAFADSKRSYVLPFYVALGDDEPQLVTTTADTALQRQLDRLALDTCRPGD